MQAPMPTTDEISAVYDELAPDWNARQGAVERVLMGDGMRAELGRMLRGNVLELGSGAGATFPFLTWSEDGVTTITATDLSAGMLAQAKRHEAIAGRPVTFQQLEATELPFEDASFDTVTTSLMLCTVPDPEATLREMSRVVRGDGRLVILEHVRARNSLIAWLQSRLSPGQQRRMGCHLDRQTDALVEEMGFSIEMRKSRFFSIFQLITLRPLDTVSG